MENGKLEKAIIQAQSSLKIDGIRLRPEFIDSFRKRRVMSSERPRSLTLKRSGSNAKRKY